MKKAAAVMLILAACTVSWALDFQEVDDIHELGDYSRELQVLQNMIYDSENDAERSEVLWRLARAQMEATDIVKRGGGDKDTLLEGFQKGVDYATDAIDADPDNYLAYFWRSANLGKWGQTKGILDSLDKAKPMRDDLIKAVNANPGHGESWKVLGMLYSQVPGLISFGDKDAAVSLGRKSVDTRDEADDFDNHYELAKMLIARDWSASKRDRSLEKKEKNFTRETNLVEKHFYYEGVVDFNQTPQYASSPLNKMSDMEEAAALLNWVRNQLAGLRNKQAADLRLMEDVEETLDEIED